MVIAQFESKFGIAPKYNVVALPSLRDSLISLLIWYRIVVTLLSLYKVIVIVRTNLEVTYSEIDMISDDGVSSTLRAQIVIVNCFNWFMWKMYGLWVERAKTFGN